MFQTVKTRKQDRSDHVWLEREKDWKCVLCGGITKDPPKFPTSEDFCVDRYEELTDEERAFSPNPNPLPKEEGKK